MMKTVYLMLLLTWPLIILTLFSYEELHIDQRALLIAFGPIVMGFVLAAWQWHTGTGIREPFTWTVLFVSVALLLVWLPLFAADRTGLGPSSDVGELVGIVLLLLSGAIGIVVGTKSAHPEDSQQDEVALTSAAPTARGRCQDVCRQLNSVKLSLPTWVWIVLGFILATFLMLFAEWSYHDLVDRGPVIQWLEWGRRMQAYDRFYGWTIGLLMIASGWASALAGMHFFRFPRPLAVGMICGATVLGAVFILHYCTSM